MSQQTGLQALASHAIENPFAKLRILLAGATPEREPTIDLTLGEPRETPPGFVLDELQKAEHLFAKYPPMRGYDVLRTSIANWATRRYGLAEHAINPETDILPTNGSREGLFYACLLAVGRKANVSNPAVLVSNPYYAAYAGAALAANAETVYVSATRETGFLPDLDALASEPTLLDRTAALFLCSPSNPQGAVASKAYLARAIELARTHNFMLFCDECYSEFYNHAPPPGGLEVAAGTPEKFQNVVVFNSLSKRSNLPGLRSAFCAGDSAFVNALEKLRNVIAPQMPGPIQYASAAIWDEETHVAANREAYQAKFETCDEVLGTRFNYKKPEGGFFLWLDVHHIGGGGEAAVTLWKREGVKVLPGAFLAQRDRQNVNPGEGFIRIALVHDRTTIREALERIVHCIA